MHTFRMTSVYFRPCLPVPRHVGNKSTRLYYSIGYATFD
jgi:hypothetical protein